MRFLGNIEAKVDAKGRVFLPAQFRKVLMAQGESELMLRQDIFENTLVLYPSQVWTAQMDEMRARLSRWDRQQQMVFRTFVSGVTGIAMDGNGRILLPRSLMQAAGIGQSVRFVGMGDTIEIWPSTPDEELTFMDKEAFGASLEALMGESATTGPTDE